MNLCLLDAEADGLEYTKIHCVSVKMIGGELHRFTDMDKLESFLEEQKVDKYIIQNGLGYDVDLLNEHTSLDLGPSNVIDTLVVSKLVNYSKFRTHSLKELGEFLGVYKGDYTGGWDVYTEEMGEYCDQDVLVLEAIFEYYRGYIFDPDWAAAMKVEHEIAYLCKKMQVNGFTFDTEEADRILTEIKEDKAALEDSFDKAFGKKLVEVNRIMYRVKADGSLYSNVVKAMVKYPRTKIDGDELVCYDYKKFNPGSPKDRIDVLWSAGWEPHEKTEGHIKKLRESRKR